MKKYTLLVFLVATIGCGSPIALIFFSRAINATSNENMALVMTGLLLIICCIAAVGWFAEKASKE